MPSPFPGMDPYLEAQGLWESFHAAMVTHSAEALNQRLPDAYVAQIETRITLYLQKRAALIERPVNFVEIDLLLGGRRTPIAGKLPAGDYYAVVARTTGRPNAQVYAWTIRHALPPIPIPLRAPDADVMLNLGEAFDLTYNHGRYARILRHGGPLPDSLPLVPADRNWAEALVK